MNKIHRPPHYHFDEKIYFLTSRCVNKTHFFYDEENKYILKNIIKEIANKLEIKIYAWTILDNHYHLLVYIPDGKNLPVFIKNINGKSSFVLNKVENLKDRKIWSNYWDTCIRSEKDFWMRFNYIHHNCIKHNYEKQMNSYQFSSYNNWVEKKGIEWVNSVFEKYSIVDFTLTGDE